MKATGITAATCLSLALNFGATSFAEAPDLDPLSVMNRIATRFHCDRRNNAEGLVEAIVLKGTGGELAATATVDFRARRFVLISIFKPRKTPDIREVRGFASLGGTHFYCQGRSVETCAWKEGYKTTEENERQKARNNDYLNFRDYLKPDGGGADVKLLPLDRSVDGSAWTLQVTAPGGKPNVWHVAADGLILAQDHGNMRLTNKTWQTIEGCDFPLLAEGSIANRPDLKSSGATTLVEFRTSMSRSDTTIVVDGVER